MAYLPIAQNLPNGAVFTADHIAHIESGILNADVDSREYIDQIAADIQAGQVTDPAFDAAVDRAAADGRLVVEGGGSAPISVTEVQQGVYELTSGENSATLYGLSSTQTLPAAAKTDLRDTFPTKDEIAASGYLTDVPDDSVASLVGNATSTTTASLAARYATLDTQGRQPVRKGELVVNVKDFGATGDGTTDDTAAIQAAWDHVNTGIRRLYFPEGRYVYNGPGLSGPNPNIHGAGREKTTLILGATSRLFDTSAGLSTADIGDFTVTGGLGLFRTTRTTNSVGGLYIIERITMKSYTAAAIENNSVDMPYWKIRDCVFDGANFTTTIGVALSGLTDGCAIENCEFLRNRVHVKLRYGGNNAYVKHCDFIRFGANQGEPRVDVWVVPRDNPTNSGAGFTLDSCKFGPENMHTTDKRIVYADEGAGTTNGDRFPALATASTGVITGHTVSNVMVGGLTGATVPLVFSTTPDVRSCSYGDLILQGSTPEFIVQFLNVPAGNRLNTSSLIGPVYGGDLGIEGGAPPKATNAPGFATLIDPNRVFAASGEGVGADYSGTPGRYLSLLRTPGDTYKVNGGVTLTPATDSLGGTDAVLAASTGGRAQVTITTSTDRIRTGEPLWVEFDAKAGTLTQLRFQMEQSGGVVHFQRAIQLRPEWRRYRFLWVPRAIPGSIHVMLGPIPPQTGDFTVGRIRAYHSSEPLNVDGLTVIGGVVHRLSVVDGVVNAVAV